MLTQATRIILLVYILIAAASCYMYRPEFDFAIVTV